jgi:kynurenine formamidase
MLIELSHPIQGGMPGAEAAFTGMRAMLFDSVGPVPHEVSIPFHDSQVRGAALLIKTGWDQRWGSEAYWEPGPFLADHLLFRMARAGVKLTGVDFPVSGRSTHTQLITSGKVAIVENLRNLSALPRLGFRFTVEPVGPDSNEIRIARAIAM